MQIKNHPVFEIDALSVSLIVIVVASVSIAGEYQSLHLSNLCSEAPINNPHDA